MPLYQRSEIITWRLMVQAMLRELCAYLGLSFVVKLDALYREDRKGNTRKVREVGFEQKW